jgi:phospholipid/cholesterol/gamma-HCH transport system substrate-binding protein
MNNSIKNFLIGIFLIAGLGLFAGLVIFLRPAVGDEKQTIYLRFSNINKINVGTRVLFAGKPVGVVTAVNEISHARETQPSDELGRLYFYQLTLKIDSKVHVYSTDQITLQTSGLLGERSIGITPRTPPIGTTPEMISDKSPVYADSVDPLENTFNRLSDIGEKLNDTVDLVKTWFEDNETNLSLAVASFGSAMTQIDTVSRSVNEHKLIPQLKEGTVALTASAQKIDNALSQMNKDGVFENFGPAVAHIKDVSKSLDTVCQTLAAGQGSFGKLFKDEDFYLRMTAVMSKMDTMMNDVNHYGVLFHLNKSWQRTRVKRVSELNALETPDSFKNYFQKEIDQINTSMARLSMVIDRSQAVDGPKVQENAKFKENFAELMRQVTEMSNNLHLYNEQLYEAIQE